MYAYGADYHDVIRKKLNELLEFLRQEVGQIQGRGFVDSAPIMEREWAKRSGLGWIGKHTLLINKQKGSYFFLSELLVDIDFVYDSPIKDYCGTCTRCIDACPTQAIHPQGFTIDASLCISYFTIEYKEELPVEMREQFDNWMFGCDICQRVCPWNRFAEAHQEPEFLPSPALLGMNTMDWQALSEETFQVLFKRSPVKRTKYAGLTRNIKFLGKMP
jgi:epoxyqueuosine reductase